MTTRKTISKRYLARANRSWEQNPRNELLDPSDRPSTREDCSDIPRPCPYVGCKYNLYLDVTEKGSLVLNFPSTPVDKIPPDRSCVLDIVESEILCVYNECMSLSMIAQYMNLQKERIRQIERDILAKIADQFIDYAPEDFDADEPKQQVA